MAVCNGANASLHSIRRLQTDRGGRFNPTVRNHECARSPSSCGFDRAHEGMEVGFDDDCRIHEGNVLGLITSVFDTGSARAEAELWRVSRIRWLQRQRVGERSASQAATSSRSGW
jgi:hypothetical protein